MKDLKIQQLKQRTPTLPQGHRTDDRILRPKHKIQLHTFFFAIYK